MKKHLILCPVDYSNNSEPAIRIATDLAQVHKSKVILLNVTDSHARPMSMEDQQLRKIFDRVRDHDLTQKDVEYEHVTLKGDPADVVVDYARNHAVDLIVMGTHGRTGLASVMAGSVAKGVMAQAGCPVITVKLPAKAGAKQS